VAVADPLFAGLAAEDPPRDEIADATALDRAMATLPDEQSHVLRRAYYGGLSFADIASDEQLPLGTVKTRARLGLARLRSLLCPEGETS
jgi:RNA polymerase sigma-70 factor (ECF subfamily)